MIFHDRITVNPQVMVGKPVVKGTRLSVEFILELLAEGWTNDQIIDQYPNLTAQDIKACLEYAVAVLRFEMVFPVAAE